MAIVIYLTGTAALAAADVIVTRSFAPEKIALWAESRALLGILGMLCTLGLDAVMMRSPQSTERLLRLAALQIPVLAVPVGLVTHRLGYLSNSLVAMSLAAAAAAGLILVQYFRAHHRYRESQIVQQGWRIGALAVIVIGLALLPESSLSLDVLLMAVLIVTASWGIITTLRLRPGQLHAQAPQSTRSLYALGLRFMITGLILALAVYGEQLTVNGVGDVGDAVIFFTHATYFLLPIAVLNGYIAFRIGPWLRDNHSVFVKAVQRSWRTILIAAFSYCCAMHCIGWIAWLIISPAAGGPDPLLQSIFFLSAFARTLYTIPSGYNGIFGSARQHDVLICSQAGLLVIIALGVVLMVGMCDLVYLIASAGAINWVVRTAIGFGLTCHIMHHSSQVCNG